MRTCEGATRGGIAPFFIIGDPLFLWRITNHVPGYFRTEGVLAGMADKKRRMTL